MTVLVGGIGLGAGATFGVRTSFVGGADCLPSAKAGEENRVKAPPPMSSSASISHFWREATCLFAIVSRISISFRLSKNAGLRPFKFI